jgi:hypothetical protein
MRDRLVLVLDAEDCVAHLAQVRVDLFELIHARVDADEVRLDGRLELALDQIL